MDDFNIRGDGFKDIIVDWGIKVAIILIIVGAVIFLFMSRNWVKQDCSDRCFGNREYKTCFKECLDNKRADEDKPFGYY